MANLLIGDIHGCYDEFMRLLEKVSFSSSDVLWLTGDLVARGPKSLEVLRFVKQNNQQIRLVLGNHDLHLLSIYAEITYSKKKDNLNDVIAAPDYDELMNWLRKQPLLQIDENLKLIMTHAGVSPQWDLETLKKCAHDLNVMLSSDSYPLFLDKMYGNFPNEWSLNLKGFDRLRYASNALTRMRFCYEDGQLDFYYKKHPDQAPAKLKPWFLMPRKIPDEYHIAFGHWAALNGKGTPENIYALDTGCCWGGKLTCLRFEDKKYFKKRNIETKNLDKLL
ncbi:bis(5'-nucleosyl)-tetraphosphatase (symmetrical) [Gilliamella sp. wkB18]|uniref:bis(5'-nucleosyl)-tetraphosphatase (symmetrical) ApaH n=1 Tax=Gilliamella sp. wkB18 TaxID=3120260 RepID=UPI0004DD6B87|nr:bis(5'-nucleosyl)-tetraphosphatase (symmetrical) ApaH [Gilliamella apicola]KFA59898.1 Bis(5'-nucleosyl)-tetraphosphatase, symmetrical [Gilliamella apicola]OCG61656.1 bis(5'-nucleosyl)-tetraphosphatase (symmetrical) [Gilliamella apicola]